MKLRHILAALLLPMAGLAQAQDMKTFMDDKRDNREANYEKWGPTSDRDGLGFIVRAGYVIGGTSPLPLPAEIRKINEFSPKGGFSLGVDGYKYFNTRWGISAGLRFFMQGMHTGANVKNYGMSIVMGEDGIPVKVPKPAEQSAEDGGKRRDCVFALRRSEKPACHSRRPISKRGRRHRNLQQRLERRKHTAGQNLKGRRGNPQALPEHTLACPV